MSESLGNTTKFSSGSEFSSQYGNSALRFYLLEIARALLPNERIQACWRYPLPTRRVVEIIYSAERNCARTSGTMKCGMGWVCPACMQYIAARRRDELQTAIERSSGKYFSIMATYTARHNQGTRLETLLASMIKAYGRVFAGRWWERTKNDWMISGAIRATEVTYGKNGWHPHFHTIMFIDRKILEDHLAGSPDEYVQSLRGEIGDRWVQMLGKVGLSGEVGVAFDLRSSDKYVAEYITKFGKMPLDWSSNASAYEVASSATKEAKHGNMSVLDILFNARAEEKMAKLFLEYHAATKGKAMLNWSHGLKKRLDIELIRDEIAAEGVETETDVLLAEVHIELWRFIVDRGSLGQVMTYANAGDASRLADLLDILGNKWGGKIYDFSTFDGRGLG